MLETKINEMKWTKRALQQIARQKLDKRTFYRKQKWRMYRKERDYRRTPAGVGATSLDKWIMGFLCLENHIAS